MLRFFLKTTTEATTTMMIAAAISTIGRLLVDAGFPLEEIGSVVEVVVGEGYGDAGGFSV